MQREDGYSRHHQIAKVKGGTWHPDNLLVMSWVQHRAWHVLHDNNLPMDALEGTSRMIKSTLHGDVFEEVNGVLRKYQGIMEIYKPHCYDRDKLSSYFSRKGK